MRTCDNTYGRVTTSRMAAYIFNLMPAGWICKQKKNICSNILQCKKKKNRNHYTHYNNFFFLFRFYDRKGEVTCVEKYILFGIIR